MQLPEGLTLDSEREGSNMRRVTSIALIVLLLGAARAEAVTVKDIIDYINEHRAES